MEISHNREFLAEKKRLLYSLLLPGIFVVFCTLGYLLGLSFNTKLSFLGIYPHDTQHLYGIISHVFVHANSGHLFSNIISFLVLSVCLFYFYRDVAYKIFFLLWLLSGILLWFIGREGCHIGASGLIYGLAFFLFWSGIFKKYTRLIAISLLVAFLYGNLVWGECYR